MSQKWSQKVPGISRKIPEISPETPKDVPGIPREPQRTPKARISNQKDLRRPPKVSPRTPNDPRRSPRDALRTHKSLQKTPQEAPKTTRNKPKIQIENRRKRHRDSDSTDATLKQDYVENDLGPAECAERLNKKALRASRQAETVIETVPFDSCRSCVAGLMVVVVVVVVRFLSLRFVCWLRKWCRWYAGGCMDFRLELWFPLGLLQVPFWTRLGVF